MCVKLNFLRKRGFTLVELLVVISIIALLLSIVLASLNSARAKARDTRRMVDISQIQAAIEIFHINNGYYPGEGNCTGPSGYWCTSTCWCWDDLTQAGSYLYKDLKNEGLFTELPKDPINNFNEGYYYRYEPECHIDSKAQSYYLQAKLETTGLTYIVRNGISPVASPPCDTIW
jgi:prepilin-type N-terminal cleavage/methylation domain-containing protein